MSCTSRMTELYPGGEVCPSKAQLQANCEMSFHILTSAASCLIDPPNGLEIYDSGSFCANDGSAATSTCWLEGRFYVSSVVRLYITLARENEIVLTQDVKVFGFLCF